MNYFVGVLLTTKTSYVLLCRKLDRTSLLLSLALLYSQQISIYGRFFRQFIIDKVD